MRFYLITNSSELARFAFDEGGVVIFVDLELIGKEARQGHLDTLISRHAPGDVSKLRCAVPRAELLVRLNPYHAGSAAEIDASIGSGADWLMLPMFRTVAEVRDFLELVDRRCRVCLLAETRDAMEGIGDFAALPGVDAVHIGLNDLSIDLGLRFMFEPLALGHVDRMAAQLRALRMPFGLGGIARADEGLLPARLLLGEHVRLGSSAAILSRTFHRQATSVSEVRSTMDFGAEITKLNAIETHFRTATPSELEENRKEVWRRIEDIARQSGHART